MMDAGVKIRWARLWSTRTQLAPPLSAPPVQKKSIAAFFHCKYTRTIALRALDTSNLVLKYALRFYVIDSFLARRRLRSRRSCD